MTTTAIGSSRLKPSASAGTWTRRASLSRPMSARRPGPAQAGRAHYSLEQDVPRGDVRQDGEVAREVQRHAERAHEAMQHCKTRVLKPVWTSGGIFSKFRDP
jgi:hypothetical protein